jgi:hypothetical protein
MLRRFSFLVVALFTLLAGTGCASTSADERFGHEARYVPAFRGYAVSRRTTFANADEAHEQAVLLRDPLRGTKIRCREDAEPTIAAWSDAIAQQVHDFGWGERSYLAMLPFSLAAIYGDIFFVKPMDAFARLPLEVERSRPYELLFRDAMIDFRAGNYDAAARNLEIVSVKTDIERGHARYFGNVEYLPYYLGLAYEQRGDRDRARIALRRFVDTSWAYDEAAYDVADARARSLGEPEHECRSQEPIELGWRAH